MGDPWVYKIFSSSCMAAGRGQGSGVSSTEGSARTALLNRDDASVGPSEDEESALLPGHSQSRRTTNGSLDSIFERMESQPVSHHRMGQEQWAPC